jgi:hypothetical protein
VISTELRQVDYLDGDAQLLIDEVQQEYVRRYGERTAASAGASRMVLETGAPQPEAVALYRSSGYSPIPAFGLYADSKHSIHLGKKLSAPS